jgi:hypothetical protein
MLTIYYHASIFFQDHAEETLGLLNIPLPIVPADAKIFSINGTP